MKQVIDEAFLSQVELFSLTIRDNVAGLFGGNHQSKKFGSSCEFADYRDYVEGDDITKIDWNLYGRFEKLYLKLYLDEKQMHTKIYLDTSTSMSFYKKSDYALRLVTTLAYLSVANMDKVSLYLIRGNQIEPVFEKVVGKENFMYNIVKMNKIKFDGDSFISEAINKSSVGYGDGKSIIISDFLTENDYSEAIDFLRSKKRDVLCIQLLADEEVNPGFRGKNLLYDSENYDSSFKKNITRDVLKAYNQALEYVKNKLFNYCSSREADYVFYPTKLPLRELFLNNLVQKGVIK